MIEALYVHIPFCVSRCAYCDFATSACHDDALMDAYVDALSMQIRRASKAGLLGALRTIYIGGGTPTHLGHKRLNSLVYLISLSVNLEGVEEFTIECNPESLDARMVKDLYALGVSRFSMGAQSFDGAELRFFGRAHDVSDIACAAAAVKEREADLSLDLICGIPGQSLETWEANVKAALDCSIDHISIYPLTVEEGTPLSARIEAGECEAPDEDLQAEMMIAAGRLCEAAGMHRYEVASYALPGHESKHNSAYWSGVSYLGLGAAAASMMTPQEYDACAAAGIFGEADDDTACDGTARLRVQADADAAAFAASLGRPFVEIELLSGREAILEDAMLAFRTSAGLSAQRSAAFCAAVPELSDALRALQSKGLIEVTCDGAQVPTQRGWLMGNEIFGTIWDLA